MAIPRLCCSHTVTGTATFVYTAATTATIAAGTYWTDPVYGSYSNTAAANLPLKIGSSMTVGGFAGAGSSTGTAISGIYYGLFTFAGGSTQFISGHASVTTEGRRMLRRVGLPTTSTYPAAASGTISAGLVCGIWEPLYCESSSLIEAQQGETGSVFVSGDGTAYTTRTASPERNRLLVLSGVPGRYVNPSVYFPDGIATPGDYSFDTLMYQWLMRGEQVRYYADKTATYTYLTSAVTATASSITVNSNTNIDVNDILCVDGERMKAIANTSGTTWSVYRHNPVAHATLSPVGVDAFVATYVLGSDGGNINRGGFNPSRRAPNQDRWDMEIALVRATP